MSDNNQDEVAALRDRIARNETDIEHIEAYMADWMRAIVLLKVQVHQLEKVAIASMGVLDTGEIDTPEKRRLVTELEALLKLPCYQQPPDRDVPRLLEE